MAKKSSNDQKIAREQADLANVLLALPDNPINWVAVLTLVAPFVARLATRLALKKLNRGMSEDKVNATARSVADYIAAIVKTRTGPGVA